MGAVKEAYGVKKLNIPLKSVLCQNVMHQAGKGFAVSGKIIEI